jgi:hypothetical protein
MGRTYRIRPCAIIDCPRASLATINTLREGAAPARAEAQERESVATVSHVTSIGCRPACTVFGVAVASPSRTKPARSPTVKPCARMVGSVTPCGLPARISSARRWSA